MQQHLDYYCQLRPFPCPLCKIDNCLKNIDSHLEKCMQRYTSKSEYESEYESEEEEEEINVNFDAVV
jgi:hypothetical protein